MNMRFTRNLRNPLLRRVQRHTNITTLFRAVEPGQAVDRLIPPGGAASGGWTKVGTTWGARPSSPGSPAQLIVQASLIPWSLVQFEGLYPPQEPPVSVGPTRTRQTATPARRPGIEPARTTPPTDQPLGSVRQPLQPVVHRQPISSPASPPVVESSPKESPAQDPIWKRLQTIFQRHQEKAGTGLEVPAEPGASSPVSAGSSPPKQVSLKSEDTSALRDRKPFITELSQAAADEEQPSGLSLIPEPPSEPVEAEIDEPETALETAQLKPVVAVPHSPPEEAGKSAGREQGKLSFEKAVGGKDEPTAVAQEELTQLVQRIADDPIKAPQPPPPGVVSEEPARIAPLRQPDAPAQKTAPQEQSPQPSAPIQRPQIPPAAKPAQFLQMDEPDQEMDAPLQAVPLEAAWPVQHLEEPQIVPLSSERSGQSLVEALDVPTQQSLQRILQTVEPGQPSGSSVEVVMPRRSRPKASPPVPTEQAAPEAQRRLQRSPIDEPAAQMPKPATDISTRSALSDHLIETEIGPLPSDLWQLIGQKPPQAARTAVPPVIPSAEEPSAPGRSDSAVLQRTLVEYQPEAVRPTREESLPEYSQLGETDALPIVGVRDEERRDVPWMDLAPLSPAVVQPSIEQGKISPTAYDAVPAAPPHPGTEMVELRPRSSQASLIAALEATRQSAETQTIVQRAAEEQTQAETSSTEEQARTMPAEGGEAGPEVDMEELATRVYAEVKRRLSIEWERMRRRF